MIRDKRILLGVIFLLIGGLILFHELDFISLSLPSWVISWKTLLIAVGLFHILVRAKYTSGAIWIVIGTIFLVPDIFHIENYNPWMLFIPALFIIIGISMLFRMDHTTRHDRFTKEESDMDRIDEIAVFGGGERIVTSQNFLGGKVLCLFGGSIINLSHAKLAKGRSQIEIFAIFGGSTFIVPDDWKVRIDVGAIFGGFADKRRFVNPTPSTDSQELIIKGFVIFGGGEIKTA